MKKKKREFLIANLLSSLAREKLRVLAPIRDKYTSESTRVMILLGGNRRCRVVTIFIHVQFPVSGRYTGHGEDGNVSAMVVL